MEPKFEQKISRKMLDLLGQKIVESVRDESIETMLDRLEDEHYSKEPIQKGYKKMSSDEREFVVEKALPYIADAVIFHFLDLLEKIDAGAYSYSDPNKEVNDSDFSDDAVRFSFLVKHGEENPFPVADFAPFSLSEAPSHLPDCCRQGWNEQFGSYPSSSIYNPEIDKQN